MKVLLITVGGSDIPVVTSIKSLKPDRVIFFCTSGKIGSRSTIDGEGLVCGDYVNRQRTNLRPNIMKQTGLTKEQTVIVEVDGDDPYDTYTKALNTIKDYHRDEIIIDYTGGTKSMTAGLFTASTEIPNSSVYLVTGPRVDMDKVRGNYSRVNPLTKNIILGKRQIKMAESFVAKQDYKGALFTITELTALEGISIETRLEQYRYLLIIFSKWDNFEYEEAREVFEIYTKLYAPNKELIDYKNMLKRLVEAKNLLLNVGQKQVNLKDYFNCLWLVYDVLKNAERKAAHNHYDDAVARIYRAIEMYAQIILRSLQINTSELDINKISHIDSTRLAYYTSKRNDKNQLQIGLRDSFDLLEDLNHPLGQVWSKYKNQITNALTTRNYSFLAHGMNPITKEDYESLKSVVWDFITQCDELSAKLSKKDIGLRYYKDLPKDLRSLI